MPILYLSLYGNGIAQATIPVGFKTWENKLKLKSIVVFGAMNFSTVKFIPEILKSLVSELLHSAFPLIW